MTEREAAVVMTKAKGPLLAKVRPLYKTFGNHCITLNTMGIHMNESAKVAEMLSERDRAIDELKAEIAELTKEE